MKNLFLLIVMSFFALNTFGQIVISNCEDIGTDWIRIPGGDTEIWDNPSKDAINSSDKALTVWINNDDPNYAGGLLGGLDINIDNNNTISVMIYKQIEGKIQLEVQNGDDKHYLHANYTTPFAWENLEFPVPEGLEKITTVLVAPHFENYEENPIPEGEAHRMWWDEVVLFEKVSTAIANTLQEEGEVVKTTVYDLSGRIVKEFDSATINQSELSNGIYLVKQLYSTGSVKTEKRIINN